MRYYIDKKLLTGDSPGDENGKRPYVEVLSELEYIEKYQELDQDSPLLRMTEKVRHCKVDVFENHIHGTLSIPVKGGLESERMACRFYLDADMLLFIGAPEWIDQTLSRFEARQVVDIFTPAQALFQFMDVLIDGEGDFMDKCEDILCRRENSMLDNVNELPKNLEHFLEKTRRELLIISRYYKQLADMGQMLADCPNEIVDAKGRKLFRFFTHRMERLLADSQNLMQYSVQIRDMFQSRITIRQNKIMQLLTVITTIFMPLSLITGWYGMNFCNMPELTWRFGYLGVAVLAAVVLVLEWMVLKKNKWL